MRLLEAAQGDSMDDLLGALVIMSGFGKTAKGPPALELLMPEATQVEASVDKKCPYVWQASDRMVGKTEVKDIPNHLAVVLKNEHSRVYKLADQGKHLKDVFSNKKFIWGNLSKCFIAAGMAQAPQLSLYALEQFIPCLCAAIFAQAGVEMDYESIAALTPRSGALCDIAIDGAADCLLFL